jgi:hypothetical protein
MCIVIRDIQIVSDTKYHNQCGEFTLATLFSNQGKRIYYTPYQNIIKQCAFVHNPKNITMECPYLIIL